MRILPLAFAAALPALVVPVGAAAEPALQAFTGGQPERLSDGFAKVPEPQRQHAPEVAVTSAPLTLAAAALPPARMKVQIQEHAPARATLAISDQVDDVRRCYQQALVRVPDLSGELTLSLAVARDGHARGEVVVDQTGDWQLVSCVNEATALWLVPDTTGTLHLTVRLRPA